MSTGKCERINDRLVDNGEVGYLHCVIKRLRNWRILENSIHEEKWDGRSSFNEGNNFRKCIRMEINNPYHGKEVINWTIENI